MFEIYKLVYQIISTRMTSSLSSGAQRIHWLGSAKLYILKIIPQMIRRVLVFSLVGTLCLAQSSPSRQIPGAQPILLAQIDPSLRAGDILGQSDGLLPKTNTPSVAPAVAAPSLPPPSSAPVAVMGPAPARASSTFRRFSTTTPPGPTPPSAPQGPVFCPERLAPGVSPPKSCISKFDFELYESLLKYLSSDKSQIEDCATYKTSFISGESAPSSSTPTNVLSLSNSPSRSVSGGGGGAGAMTPNSIPACPFLPNAEFDGLLRDATTLSNQLASIANVCNSDQGTTDIVSTADEAKEVAEAAKMLASSWKDQAKLTSDSNELSNFRTNLEASIRGISSVTAKLTNKDLRSECINKQLKNKGLLPTLANISNRIAPVAIEATRFLGPSGAIGELLIGGANTAVTAFAELQQSLKAQKIDFDQGDNLQKIRAATCDFARLQGQLQSAIQSLSDLAEGAREARFNELSSEGVALKNQYIQLKKSEANTWLGCEMRNLDRIKTAALLISKAATADLERIKQDYTSKLALTSQGDLSAVENQQKICRLGLDIAKNLQGIDPRQFPRRVDLFLRLGQTRWQNHLSQEDQALVSSTIDSLRDFEKLAGLTLPGVNDKNTLNRCAQSTSKFMYNLNQLSNMALKTATKVVREKESQLEKASLDFQRTNMASKNIAQAMNDARIMQSLLAQVQSSFTLVDMRSSLHSLQESFLSDGSAMNQLLEYYQKQGSLPYEHAQKVWKEKLAHPYEGSLAQLFTPFRADYRFKLSEWFKKLGALPAYLARGSRSQVQTNSTIQSLGMEFSEYLNAQSETQKGVNPRIVSQACVELGEFSSHTRKYGEILYILDALCGSVNLKLVHYDQQTSKAFTKFLSLCSKSSLFDNQPSPIEKKIREYQSDLEPRRQLAKDLRNRLGCSTRSF